MSIDAFLPKAIILAGTQLTLSTLDCIWAEGFPSILLELQRAQAQRVHDDRYGPERHRKRGNDRAHAPAAPR